MKKITASLLAFMFIFLCSCNSGGQSDENTSIEITTKEAATLPPEATTADSLQAEEVEPAKILVVSFSHHDPVESFAEYISEKTGSDICKVGTVKVYPEDEKEFLAIAADEHQRNARPAVVNTPSDIFSYDIVFFCFPSWDGTLPMALCTFIEDYDMRDMAIIPVMYGTQNDLKQATADIYALEPQLILVNGFNFTTDLATEKTAFDAWIDNVLYG